MQSKNICLSKSEENFLAFVQEIESNKVNDEAIRKSLKKYDVKSLKIHHVTPRRSKNIYNALLKKYQNGVTTKKNWLENERKLFVWCVVCYSFKNSLELSEFVKKQLNQKDSDLRYLQSMFPLKDMDVIKFQINSLIKKENKSSSWEKEEDKILFQVMQSKDTGELDWTTISKEFFALSHENFFRNGKQCRERWLNHLDPHKVKGKWTLDQDFQLLKAVKEYGKKWSQISKILENKKNEHTVKNRYKSIIYKKQKTLNENLPEEAILEMVIVDYNSRMKMSKEERSKLSSDSMELENEDDENEQQNHGNELESQNVSQRSSMEVSAEKKEVKKTKSFAKNKHNKNAMQKFIFSQTSSQLRRPKVEEENLSKNQVQIYGNRSDVDMYNQLFRNACTPIEVECRNTGGIESRSPANLFVSPFPRWGSIVQAESPQVNILDSFNQKFQNQFHKFIKEKNNDNDQQE